MFVPWCVCPYMHKCAYVCICARGPSLPVMSQLIRTDYWPGRSFWMSTAAPTGRIPKPESRGAYLPQAHWDPSLVFNALGFSVEKQR
jgi:hypothetical protein